jgi:glycosyltransferase involved in cell wall biosynthesis
MVRITCSIMCYNYGRYLGKAIESCLNQIPGDYDLETLVIDDGSTDETPEVCAQYASRIRFARFPNEGFGASLTRAVEMATGDYVFLLDADDYFRPDKIRVLLPWLETRPLLVNHRAYWIDESGDFIDRDSHDCPTSALCLRRDAALTLLPVDNELHFMPLDLPGHNVHLTDPLTYYRVHKASMQKNPVPGVWQTQVASVNRKFVARIDSLLEFPPFWLTNRERLLELKAEAETVAAFSELEASLQKGQRSMAVKRAFRFCLSVARTGKGKGLVPKMLIRTVLGTPTFRVKC